MDNAIVERAVQALAALNGRRSTEADSLRLRANAPALVARPEATWPEEKGACGMPHCAGCYVVDDKSGAKLHPPKCSEDYLEWRRKWEAKGPCNEASIEK